MHGPSVSYSFPFLSAFQICLFFRLDSTHFLLGIIVTVLIDLQNLLHLPFSCLNQAAPAGWHSLTFLFLSTYGLCFFKTWESLWMVRKRSKVTMITYTLLKPCFQYVSWLLLIVLKCLVCSLKNKNYYVTLEPLPPQWSTFSVY